MARDLYRATHKAMRKDLFEVSARIAVTDFSDPGEVDLLRARFGGLLASLDHHAETEDGSIHALAREVAADRVAAVESEHAALEADQAGLADELSRLEPGPDAWDRAHAFYLRFNRFVARYLLHIDREERELMPQLTEKAAADRLDALALADYQGPVEMLVGAMEHMMPLFNVDDRRQIVRDIRAARSVADFAQVAEAGRRALGAERWAELAD